MGCLLHNFGDFVDWIIKMSVQTFLPLQIKSTEGVILCIIIVDVHQFIGHCLIPCKNTEYYYDLNPEFDKIDVGYFNYLVCALWNFISIKYLFVAKNFGGLKYSHYTSCVCRYVREHKYRLRYLKYLTKTFSFIWRRLSLFTYF